MKAALSTSVIQGGRGGVGQYVFALVRALRRHQGEIDLTLFVLDGDAALFDFARDWVRVERVSEKWRPPVKDILWHQCALPERCRRLGIEVLHVPSYRRMVARGAMARVATIHDLAPFTLPGKYEWKRMIYGRHVARRLAAAQDRVIAVSERTASDLRRHFQLKPDAVRVVLNGLDHSRFCVDAEAGAAARRVAARHGLEAPYYLYVARLEHPGKNHVRLISAFAAFKRAAGSEALLVFGGSDWHGAEAIHKAIASSSARDAIRVLGFAPDDALPDLYRAARGFVYPSLFEGFGMPPTEAMACGCPVICSDRGALKEVVGDAALIVDPENEDSLRRALETFDSDPQARSLWRERGLRNADRFRWERAAEETVAIYREAAGRR